LLKLTPAKGFHLELDLGYSTMAVAGVERPYFPKLAMAVDRATLLVPGRRSGKTSEHLQAFPPVISFFTVKQPGRTKEMVTVSRDRRPRDPADLAVPAGLERGIAALGVASLTVSKGVREPSYSSFRAGGVHGNYGALVGALSPSINSVMLVVNRWSSTTKNSPPRPF